MAIIIRIPICKIILLVIFTILLSLDISLAQTAEDFVSQGMEKASKGDYKGAILNYDKAIELNPNDTKACLHRGLYRVKWEQYRSSINSPY